MDIKLAKRMTYDVEYVVVTEENFDQVAEWCGGIPTEEKGARFIRLADQNARNARQNKAFVDDYVLKYGTTFKSFSKRAFYKSFEDVELVHTETNKIARSAVDGQFVSPEEAMRNPDTTVIEEIPRESRWTDEELQALNTRAQTEQIASDERPPGETPREDLRGL